MPQIELASVQPMNISNRENLESIRALLRVYALQKQALET
jgi:hypothetical protein